MPPISLKCRLTGKPFILTDEDQAMLEKISPTLNGKKLLLPFPTLCPEERQRRRMSFRNHNFLYHRKCDKTGKPLISLYDSDSLFTIYNQELYWSDEWDAKTYGRDFDFKRPFFQQFAELQKVVPRLAINGINNENCDYTSYCGFCKNCYLTFTADRNEDCYFGAYSFDNKNCADFLFIFNCELCYEVTDCNRCFHCFYGFNLEHCSDCFFCRDCIGCHDCFGSVNLRNKSYYFCNKPLTKEAYDAKIKALRFDSYAAVKKLKQDFIQFSLQYPRKALDIKGSEEVTGDHVQFSRRCFNAYDVRNCEDCRYISHLVQSKDCMDWDFYGDRAEMCYEMSSCAGDIHSCAFCTNSWENNSDLLYCDLMTASKNCFGCISLKHAEYCILNKQYTQAEYEKLLPQIIAHMEKAKEWGEFFPSTLAPHAYNETLAHDYLPITEEEAKKRGLGWKNQKEKGGYQGKAPVLPDSIRDVDASVEKDIFTCEKSQANYKIISQELKFYQKYGIPLPHRAPHQRYLDRMELRNPRQQWTRPCQKCGKPTASSYDPKRPEIVFCEGCYLNEVD